jgi:hypothetical protein
VLAVGASCHGHTSRGRDISCARRSTVRCPHLQPRQPSPLNRLRRRAGCPVHAAGGEGAEGEAVWVGLDGFLAADASLASLGSYADGDGSLAGLDGGQAMPGRQRRMGRALQNFGVAACAVTTRPPSAAAASSGFAAR